MLRYAEDVVEKLEKLDRIIGRQNIGLKGKKLPFIMFGGAAVLLAQGGKRWTKDVDILVTSDIKGIGNLLTNAGGIHLTSDVIAYLHPDYLDRIEKSKVFDNVVIYTLAPVDIAISKTARGFEKDFYDIYVSDLSGKMDLPGFEKLYREGMPCWIGGSGINFGLNLNRALGILRDRKTIDRTDIFTIVNEVVNGIETSGMLTESVELNAIRYLIGYSKDEREKLLKPGVYEAAAYLIKYAGESLADSKAEVAFIELLRRHFRLTHATEKKDISLYGVNAAELLKIFKTVSHEVMDRMTDERRQEITDTFTRPG